MEKFPLVNIFDNPNFRKVFENILWLSLDKVIRMGVGIFVTGWVARYLGPEQFGIWNFAIAFTLLFSALANLGLDGIVVREIIKNPEKTGILLGTSFFLRLLGSAVAFILCLVTAYISGHRDTTTLLLIVLYAGGFIFQSLLVIDYYNQANIKSKYTVWAQNIAFTIITTTKIVMILIQAPLIAFGITGLIEQILTSIFIFIFYKFNKSNSRSSNKGLYPINLRWEFSSTVGIKLIKESWPLLIGSISIMIYMRIDQVMIKEILGDRDVGLYSAIVKISELWYFIPMAINTSIFPKIVEYKNISEELYYNRLQKYFCAMAWIGIITGFLVTILGEQILHIVFGSDYVSAARTLQIHIWSGVFVCLGVASSGWILAENLQTFSLYRTLAGAICNIILNLALIPLFSINGAAISTLISHLVADFLFDTLNKKTIRLFKMKVKAIIMFRI